MRRFFIKSLFEHLLILLAHNPRCPSDENLYYCAKGLYILYCSCFAVFKRLVALARSILLEIIFIITGSPALYKLTINSSVILSSLNE